MCSGLPADPVTIRLQHALANGSVAEVAAVLLSTSDSFALAGGLTIDPTNDLFEKSGEGRPDLIALKGIAKAALSSPSSVPILADAVLKSLDPTGTQSPEGTKAALEAAFSDQELMNEVDAAGKGARRKLMVDGGRPVRSYFCPRCQFGSVCTRTIWWCIDS